MSFMIFTKLNPILFSKELNFSLNEAKSVQKRFVKTPFTCPHDGYFPDQDDCAKYYLCSGASMTSHDCGEGLTWDAELQLCGWANTIDCRNGDDKINYLFYQ